MITAAIGAGVGGLVVGAFGFRGVFTTMAGAQFMAAIIAYRMFYHKA